MERRSFIATTLAGLFVLPLVSRTKPEISQSKTGLKYTIGRGPIVVDLHGLTANTENKTLATVSCPVNRTNH